MTIELSYASENFLSDLKKSFFNKITCEQISCLLEEVM